jgi:hypothetical protein
MGSQIQMTIPNVGMVKMSLLIQSLTIQLVTIFYNMCLSLIWSLWVVGSNSKIVSKDAPNNYF